MPKEKCIILNKPFIGGYLSADGHAVSCLSSFCHSGSDAFSALTSKRPFFLLGGSKDILLLRAFPAVKSALAQETEITLKIHEMLNIFNLWLMFANINSNMQRDINICYQSL